MQRKIRVLFLIPSLVAHGAERQLTELAQHMEGERFEVHIALFYGPEAVTGDSYWAELAGHPGVQLHDLGKKRGASGYLRMLARLLSLAKRLDPDVLHGYMDGNLPLLPVARALRKPLIWGIRRTSADLSKLDRASLWLTKLEVQLARFADLVIFNSEAGRANHQLLGMKPRRACVIPNGFDTRRFSPDPSAGAGMRRTWGVPEEAPLVGIVGRFHPVKDHPTFLRAAAAVKQRLPLARFVCVGGGARLDELKRRAETLGLADSILWPGTTGNMKGVYNALSLLVLSSTDEGFPNVLGEAMACGTPCVSTHVGDAAVLTGGTGRILPIGDAEGIAEAVLEMLTEDRAQARSRSSACRDRICRDYGADTLARRTEQTIESLLEETGRSEQLRGHRIHC